VKRRDPCSMGAGSRRGAGVPQPLDTLWRRPSNRRIDPIRRSGDGSTPRRPRHGSSASHGIPGPPIHHGGELIGMIGLANRKPGCDQELVESERVAYFAHAHCGHRTPNQQSHRRDSHSRAVRTLGNQRIGGGTGLRKRIPTRYFNPFPPLAANRAEQDSA
jgi:hypothetical protein